MWARGHSDGPSCRHTFGGCDTHTPHMAFSRSQFNKINNLNHTARWPLRRHSGALSKRWPALATGGFTLVEMLVVLLVIGIMAGLVGVITRPNDRALLEVEAQRLAQLLDLAATEAQLGGQPIAWTAEAYGYRFLLRNTQDGWNEIHDNDTLRARALPQGMQFASLYVDNRLWSGDMRLEFAPSAPPHAFSVGLTNGAARTTVAGSALGEVQVLRRDE